MITKTPRSWLSSPLGVNVLLTLCGEKGPVIDKYAQIYSEVKNNNAITVRNKILISPKGNTGNIPKYPNTDVQQIDLNKNGDLRNVIITWAKQYDVFKQNIESFPKPETESLFLNISTIKGKWNSPIDGKAPVMKVYNSFNYTQDVKYEARLLELPLQDDNLKLVITVPNEKDTLSSLVATLTNKGLEDTINSIQPLFTACSVLNAPEINFDSVMTAAINKCKAAVQYGSIDVTENGLSAKVLTCLFPHTSGVNSSEFKEERTPSSFFFAITFKGTAIFTGNYIPS